MKKQSSLLIISISILITLLPTNILQAAAALSTQEYTNNEEINFTLSIAVEWGDIELAEKTLKQGANPNILSSYQIHAPLLIIAISTNNINMVQLLLKYGADINIQNENGETTLDKAFEALIPAHPHKIRKKK